MVIFNYQILIILTLIITINSAKLKKDDELFLIQTEYEYNATKFNVTVLNRENALINDQLSSRIAFLNNTESDKVIFDLYCNYINRFWLFLVNSSEVADQLLLRDDYEDNELIINGILIPKRLNYKMPEKNNNKNIPIFIIDDNYTDFLYSLDIRNMKKHVYFIFYIRRAITSYPEGYFLTIAILSLILGIGSFTYWRLIMKATRRAYILSIHRFLYTIPFFISLLSIFFFIKSIDVRGQDPYKELDDSVYIDTALVLLYAIYRALLWFLILLMCCGWKISMQHLGREELKFLIKMFLFIYIAVCLDQILDSAFEGLWLFHLSEIKNFFFYLGMLYLLLKKIKRNTIFLQRRLYYARALSLEYVEALIYKINMINKFKLMLYIYLGLFLLAIFIHKVIVNPYDTTTLELYDYYIIDLYLSLYFLFLLRPKVLPPNFNVDLGDDIEEDIGVIYKAFLTKYQDANKMLDSSQKELLSCKDKEIPILILGPCLSHISVGEEDYSINNYINNVEVGFAKK
jgi:hypothetical protein